MTRYIARIKPDFLRKAVWIFWFPVVFIDLQIEFWSSPRLNDLTWLCWDLGWKGVSDV